MKSEEVRPVTISDLRNFLHYLKDVFQIFHKEELVIVKETFATILDHLGPNCKR